MLSCIVAVAALKGWTQRRPVGRDVLQRIDRPEHREYWQEEAEVECAEREVVPADLLRVEAAAAHAHVEAASESRARSG